MIETVGRETTSCGKQKLEEEEEEEEEDWRRRSCQRSPKTLLQVATQPPRPISVFKTEIWL